MSTLFKDIYSPEFYEQFAAVLNEVLEDFSVQSFHELIFIDVFPDYELKQRMAHTAEVLHHFMPKNFVEAVVELKKIIDQLRALGIEEKSIEYMFLPEYISLYGADDFQSSVDAFEYVTQYTSCEFAVRPFLIRYETAMLEQMTQWSTHENHWVRRLSTEGSRPRLPWAMALPSFKKDPTHLLPLLENLKDDESETVRRSVANNLNDIAKDNPDIVIGVAQRWLGRSKNTDALVKHACRTLLKAGHPHVLPLFGLSPDNIELLSFDIVTSEVSIGDSLEFQFSFINRDKEARKVRIEYGLYYLKKNGELSRKVFKVSEREVAENEESRISRKQSFKRITTRVFYAGEHELSIILNGKESKGLSFILRE